MRRRSGPWPPICDTTAMPISTLQPNQLAAINPSPDSSETGSRIAAATALV